MSHSRSLVAFGACALGLGISAGPANAAWSPTTTLGAATQFDFAVAPSGSAAVAFQTLGGPTYLVRRPVHGPFSAAQAVSPGGDQAPVLESLAVADPAAVLVFQNNDETIVARRQPAAGDPLDPGQTLVPRPGPDNNAGEASLVTTATGAVIASTLTGEGGPGAAVLPFGATGFGDARRVEDNCSGGVAPALAADAAGGVFAATGGGGCSQGAVFYRPSGGVFGPGRPIGSGAVSRFAISAGGSGHFALARVYGGYRPGHVSITVGRAGHVGRPHLLARTAFTLGTYILGDVVGRTGNATVAWAACDLRTEGCSVNAVRGNTSGRFGKPRRLATSPHSATIGAWAAVGPETIALQYCHGPKCTISAIFAGAGYGFSRPVRVTANGAIDQLAADRAGDEVLVWTASDGSLWAAARRTGRKGFGPHHRVSAPGSRTQDVTAVYGPRGEALVAWRAGGNGVQPGQVQAAVYDR